LQGKLAPFAAVQAILKKTGDWEILKPLQGLVLEERKMRRTSRARSAGCSTQCRSE
jgi:hypothetical protein